MLEAVGINETHEHVYRVLLRHPPATAEEIATRAQLNPEQLTSVLSALEGYGLVSRTSSQPPTFTAAPPETALESLVLQRQEQLEQVRLASVELMQDYRHGMRDRPGKEPTELVEIVVGPEAIAQRFEQLQRSARQEVKVLDRPPYTVLYTEANTTEVAEASLEFQLLQRGVSCRTIYDHRAFEMAGTDQYIERLVDAGESARVLADVPTKLAIADNQLGMVPLRTEQPGPAGAALIHSSALLDALSALFERLWRVATPFSNYRPQPTSDSDGPSDDERRLLTLMLSGMTDEGLSRHFGVSQRTIYRRVRALMARVGVDTRLQLIWHATRHGWFDTADPQ